MAIHGIYPQDGTAELKFVLCPIVSNCTSYGMNFLRLNIFIIYSQHMVSIRPRGSAPLRSDARFRK